MEQFSEEQAIALAQTFATQMATAPKGTRAQLTRAARFSKNIDGEQARIIKKKIKDNQVIVRDFTVVYTVALKGTNIKLFESNVSKTKGLVTLNQGKLAEKQYFAPNTIRARVGIAPNATPTNAQILALTYQNLNAFPAVETGELQIKCGNDMLLDEFNLSSFDTTGRNDIVESTYELDNPLLFIPNTQIHGHVEFNADITLPANAYLQIVMKGAEMILL
jgi:hypothetical protein